MWVLLISLISVILVIGVATTVYVQNSKQKKLYDQKLTEVVSKTDNANQYEYEKNKDQEVSLDKVKNDMVNVNNKMAAVNKDMDYFKKDYATHYGNVSKSLSDVQTYTSKSIGIMQETANEQKKSINGLTLNMNAAQTDIKSLNDKFGVINGQLVNIGEKQQSQIDKLTKDFGIIQTAQGTLTDNITSLKNDLNSSTSMQNKTITDFKTSTNQRLNMQQTTNDNVLNKATMVENNLKTVNTALENLKQSLNDYMLKANMKDYATKTDLKGVQNIFSDYLTKTDFTTFKNTLPDYPTRQEMNVLVNNFLTKSELTQIYDTVSKTQTALNQLSGLMDTMKTTYVTQAQLLQVTGDQNQGTVNISSLKILVDNISQTLTTLQTNITTVKNDLDSYKTAVDNKYALKTQITETTAYIDQQIALLKKTITNTYDTLTVNSSLTANGDVILNNIKMSRNWTGYPDSAVDKSEISNDTTNFKKLMIVGNKSAGGLRSVGVWDNLDVNNNLTSKQFTTDKINITPSQNTMVERKWGSDGDRYGMGQFDGGMMRMYTATDYPGKVALSQAKKDGSFDDILTVKPDQTIDIKKGLNVLQDDPGVLIEKNYNSSGNRYGLGQFPNANARLYTATDVAAKLHLSQAKKDGTFNDVLTINPDTSINMNTNKVVFPGGSTLSNLGRQNIYADDLLYLLPKNGTVVGKEWGGNGNLQVQGNLATLGNVSGDQIITNKGINVQNTDPGALIEKQYNNSPGNRFGIGQYSGGQTKVYTATDVGGTISLSQAKKDGSFNDVLMINADSSITMNTPKLCINKTCLTEADLTKILKISLYNFTTHRFTTAGSSGRLGPTLAQCKSAYSTVSWIQDINNFNMTTQGIQQWKVPISGSYTITCAGAIGGSVNLSGSSGLSGGSGRIIKATFTFNQGQIINIIVGQKGGTKFVSGTTAGGGGGASVVYDINGTLYLIGAGGGGSSANDSTIYNANYVGGSPTYVAQAGIGQTSRLISHYGGGGGSWLISGSQTAQDGSSLDSNPAFGSTLKDNAVGGMSSSGGGGEGGFGGGGRGGNSNGAGGGGGGYQGGDGGRYDGGGQGGKGGYCYSNGSGTTDMGNNSGDGYVIITLN